MKFKITLTADIGRDSKAEVERELGILAEITGQKPQKGVEGNKNAAVFEGEFHELYLRIKERIMRKIQAYD